MKLFIVVAVIVLAACTEKPLSTIQSNNPNYQVDKLFSHEGCDVYRFEDGGHKYFVRCADKTSVSTNWTETCGRGCSRNVNVVGATKSTTPTKALLIVEARQSESRD